MVKVVERKIAGRIRKGYNLARARSLPFGDAWKNITMKSGHPSKHKKSSAGGKNSKVIDLPNHQLRKLTVLSLFTGGMGLDIGFEQTGRFELLACVEKIPAFCETIRVNRDAGRLHNRNLRVYDGDVSNLDPRKVMRDLGLKKGELDVLIGGPPCQSFSTSGRRAGVQDPRGTLLWQFLRFVELLQPKMFLMENVRGLMSAALRHRPIDERPEKGGAPLSPDEQPGSVIKLFLKDLHDKYRLDCFEVNAVNYGAPQLRERVIFIGNRFNLLVEFPTPTHTNQTLEGTGESDCQTELFQLNERVKMFPFRTLGDALEGLHESKPVIIDFSPRKRKYLAMVPPGGNWRCLPEDIAREAMGKAFYAKGGRSGWWRRLSFDLPAPTILTLPNHAGTALCHPVEVRALTLRECARIQEFPDEWEFCGSPSEQYMQVGNAVPVRLGKVCGDLIARELDLIYSTAFQRAEGSHPIFRVVYLNSHVRTRKWYRSGKQFVWRDGEKNSGTSYSPGKTQRKERSVWEG